jgi:hypothetical protein
MRGIGWNWEVGGIPDRAPQSKTYVSLLLPLSHPSPKTHNRQDTSYSSLPSVSWDPTSSSTSPNTSPPKSPTSTSSPAPHSSPSHCPSKSS